MVSYDINKNETHMSIIFINFAAIKKLTHKKYTYCK